MQKLRKQRKRPNRYDEVGLFSGILFCADCGSVMYQQRHQTEKRRQDCYICGSYKIFLLPVLSILLFCFSIFAAEGSTKQVMVELEAIAEEKEHFTPNETAGYRLTLKNKLGPAWIRVKFDLSGKNIDWRFTDKDLQIQDGWINRGGYFYYTKKADAYTDGIRIPDMAVTDKQSREKRASVTVSVYSEAIQYDSITPDFSSETPWDKEEPQHTANYVVGMAGD